MPKPITLIAAKSYTSANLMNYMIIGSKILTFYTLTSTNSHAINLLSSESPQEGTIIRTFFQSAGRGQPGNKWESEYGRNLLFSIILYPENITPGNQFLVSMAISLGISDYLNKILKGVSIKWPNDIYVNNDKIAGILIESSTMGNKLIYMIAGIGLNVNQEKFTGTAPNPVSMKMITATEYPAESVLKDLAACLDYRYNMILTRKFSKIKKDYSSMLFRAERWTSFRDEGGDFTGRILSVDTGGRMTVEKRNGKKIKYYFKEVEFIL